MFRRVKSVRPECPNMMNVEQAMPYRCSAQPSVAVIDSITAYHATQLLELHCSLLINITTCTVILCTGLHVIVLL